MSVQVSIHHFSAVVLPDEIIRHEKPTEGALAKQNIQDRYHGRSDPVAQKIMAKHAEDQGLKPPEDTSIVRGHSVYRINTPIHITSDVVVLIIATCRSYRTVITDHCHQVTTFHEPR